MPKHPTPSKPADISYLEAALPALWSAIVRHLDMFEDDQPEAVTLSPSEHFYLRFATLLTMTKVEGEQINLGSLRFGEVITGGEGERYPAIMWTPTGEHGRQHILIRPPEAVSVAP